MRIVEIGRLYTKLRGVEKAKNETPRSSSASRRDGMMFPSAVDMFQPIIFLLSNTAAL